jgi:two-component system response regulator PilR (NtrC family)
MKNSSPEITFDNRLLAVEEQLKQRRYDLAVRELSSLPQSEFASKAYELGLYHLLQAECCFSDGNYRCSLDNGLKAAKILADFPLNRRYGRVQLILSKTYSALGDLKNAEIRARDALAAYRRANEPVGQVDSLNELARIHHIRCDYQKATEYLSDAVAMVADNPRKVAQLTGNLGMIRIRNGQWNEAEKNLAEAYKYNKENNQEISQAINLLSLGYLHLRRRHFILASRHFDQALEIISRLGLKREKIIHLEYTGELAFAKGDNVKAKALLSDAYQKGMLLAPGSSLVSQAGRRLAEVELALDNVDEAMKYAQKALDLSSEVGERLEVGLSKAIIARVFAVKSDYDEALEYIEQGVNILREVGEPYELSRTLLLAAVIRNAAGTDEPDAVNALLKDAHRRFRGLKLDYWIAEVDFQIGVFACQCGNLSHGFKKLNRAEKVFARLDEKVRVRAVLKFLQTLSEQAVALSVSQQNQYKIFGNLITPTELSNLKGNQMEDILEVLLKRTRGDRTLLYMPSSDNEKIVASFKMTTDQAQRFVESFDRLIGEEVSRHKPSLILDCRRDPFLNNLIPDVPTPVASVMVVPFRMSARDHCFLYIDRLSCDNTLDPFSQEELNFAVGFSDLIGFKWTDIQKNRLLQDNLRLKSQLIEGAAFPNIITQAPEMLKILTQVQQVVDSNIAVSIEGETGTGKDILARAIHYNSSRRDQRFISVNCAALPETLLESELFGYMRGAFTGADRDKNGLFEEADGGTFFLDEIADMPLCIQAKILRVLEEKEIVRLGDTAPRKVDVRIISATNKDLKEQMGAGQFRQDLYYRLSAFSFRLPPLRERKCDIPLLASHFLEGANKRLSAETLKALDDYDWPGNVRELDNEIKKLVLLTGDVEVIEADILSAKFSGPGSESGSQDIPTSLYTDDMVFSGDYSLYDFLREHEKRFIIRALREKKGVKKHAAVLLNIPESTLRLKIKDYGIDLERLDSY